MKRNKLSIFLLTVASGFLLCQNAGAFALVTEPFANYQTARLGDTSTGANGGNVPNWNTAQNSITVTNGSGSLDGSALNLVASTGDKVYIDATNNLSNGAYLKYVNAGAFSGQATNSIYYSFLYKFKSGSTVSNAGLRVVQVNKQNSGYTSAGNITHFFLIAREVAGPQIQLGIAKNPGQVQPALTNWVSTPVNYDQTFFVVIKSQVTGASSNEVESLWINPPAASFGTNEANVPTPSATAFDGTDDTSTTGQGRFFVDSCGQYAEFDELRIATNWADATPWFGQCLTALITANPLNATNVEGLNASFFVTAPCTSPTYQWQISKNSGATWSDIPGAILYRYTTPTLWIASDQGNQYRCVVTTPCNGGQATSTAASLKLNTAVNTPVSLIMYDDFSDTFRGLGPVTTNNSVWFTDSRFTGNLQNDGGSPLFATPVSGSSTLWLAYFRDETNGVASSLVPVTLDVTNAIKVTLPFHVGSMGSHTNNGAMRFGLFDYADGGTLFTNDSTQASGSAGNGLNVRGYMLSVDFGTNFTANSPLSLQARNGLTDANLMGTTGNYLSLGSGPSGGGYTNAPAFKPNTDYTLVFQVTRTATNACRVTATITGVNYAGVSTNWSFSALDNNDLGYHRFDSFAMRPNSLETTADQFSFPYFEVQVVPTAWEIGAINPVSVARSGNDINLSWTPDPAPSVATFTYSVQYRTNLLETSWHTLQTNITTTAYTATNMASTNVDVFYRIRSP